MAAPWLPVRGRACCACDELAAVDASIKTHATVRNRMVLFQAGKFASGLADAKNPEASDAGLSLP
ncbi:hypothetical protein KMZ93_17230 [Bradyrhizobium sediminis]|uniref:Uncharacterized protein n=1 Tax=Bradyrhizobium sediminis TaxID=2840469 RepID=A0A975NVX6_9BRAD|nr:hypothetical protein [Bradyrhizobium sediminis]QWG21731.1 hypothetical protein KMZ93_17230 [Bradyrhizobium sediminis]